MCVPAGSRRDQQQAYFIGGSEELQDLTYVAVPQGHTGKVLNKYGYKTQTSGNVKVGARETGLSSLDRACMPSDQPPQFMCCLHVSTRQSDRALEVSRSVMSCLMP